MLEHLIHTNTWFPRHDVELAEQKYFHVFANKSVPATTTTATVEKEKKVEQPKVISSASSLPPSESLTEQIRTVRKLIENTSKAHPAVDSTTLDDRLAKIESQQSTLLQLIDALTKRVEQLESHQNNDNEESNLSGTSALKSTPAPAPTTTTTTTTTSKDEDDIDLFASEDEEESEETKKRLADYAAKKATKTQVIAKSTIVLDVKPWDDETDLEAMEKAVRSIEADGLVWGQSKLLPVAYGVKKLQIGCVVEDDKIGTDFLEEKICEFEDYVQSIDVVSFNKI